VVMAIVSTWAIGVFQLVQNVLRFLLRPRAFAVASLLFSVGGLAVGVALVVGLDAGVAGVFAGQAVGGLLGTAAAVLFTRSLYRPHFDWASMRRMLAFSVPLVPASLGVFVTLYIDRIALNQLATLSAVGIFGIGYRLASLVSLLLIGFQIALTPIIYMRYREPSTPGELARAMRMFVGFALLVTLTLSIWAPEMLRVITPPEYWPADAVVPLLAPAILLANMYVFMPGLAIANRTRTIAVITIAGAVMNTTLNLALIPLLGVRGAALATLISAMAVFAGYVRTSQLTYPVPHRWAPYAIAIGGYGVLVPVALSLEPMTVGATVAKVLATAALAALVIATGLVTRSELDWGTARPRRRLSPGG
jgi:O-antigen/teichoic acid export membrane protein